MTALAAGIAQRGGRIGGRVGRAVSRFWSGISAVSIKELRSRMRGLVVGTAMAGVYGVLYVLVLSEDYALLLGAIVLFAALAAVMLVTRRIDWYRLSAAADSQETEAEHP